MQDARNLADVNDDLFMSHIDFMEINRNKSLKSGLRVFTRVIYSKEARKKFGEILDRVHPDIVHVQNIHGHISPSIIYEAKARGLPVVWTLHDYKLVCPNTHFLIDSTGEICEACLSGNYCKAIAKRCKKGSLLASTMAAIEAYAHRIMKVREKVDMFLAPSAFLRSKLIRVGFPAEKVVHIPLFISDEMFADKGGRDEGYLFFMAKLDPIKGIFPLLDACRKIPSVTMKLAGGIEDSLVKDLLPTLPANVEYLGMLHGEALRTLLLNARAVILPSLWYENQPFAITEAFAAGKPVIASDLGGMTELVKHRERGLLVPPGDAKALAEAMLWMDRHPTEAKKMGEHARKYSMMEHSSERHYGKLMQVYTKILETR